MRNAFEVCMVALLLAACQSSSPETMAQMPDGDSMAAPQSAAEPAADTAEASATVGRQGFETRMEDGRLWVLRPNQEPSEKHVTLIGAGPGGVTIMALDRDTALAYLATKPGFDVRIEDGRVWVLRPGQEPSEKHVTLIGAGPMGTTLKAIDSDTALAYLATVPGFEIQIENGRVWALRPGQEKDEKCVTAIGVGPRGSTVKAVDRATLDAYLAALGK